MKRSTYLKAGIFVLLIVTAVVVQVSIGLPSRAELQSVLDGLGAIAVPVFILAYIGASLLPIGPSAVLTIVGGALLGFAVAFASVLVAAVIGSTIGFLISRSLGREAIQGLSNERVRDLDARVSAHGFGAVLLARMVPLIPFTTSNYAFGLTSIPLTPYVLGTALGIVPGTAVYVAVGAYGAEPTSPPFLIAIGALVLLTVVWLARSRREGRAARGGGSHADADGGPR